MTRLVAAPVAVAALALAVAAGLAPAAVKPHTISLLEVSRSLSPTGGLSLTEHTIPTPGQGFVLENDLYKWNGPRRGVHYGTLQATCVFTKRTATAAWLHCNGAALLPGGQIAFSGIITQSDVFRVPIVGGTGVYTGARGYVHVKSISESNSADTFHITD